MGPRERAFEHLLVAAFEAAGWAVASGGSPRPEPDLLVRRDGLAFAIVLRVWKGKAWKQVLRALFADAALQARAAASDASTSPLAIVAAAEISDSMAADLAEYRERFAPDVAWGLADARGRFELHGAGLESVGDGAPDLPPLLDRASKRASRSSGSRDRRVLPSPFSDLGQWALKVLLAPEIASNLLAAPRHRVDGRGDASEAAPVRSVRDLAQRAGISEPRASDVVAALERQGFLERYRHALILVRRSALFDAWRAEGAGPAEEFGARFALQAKDPLERLDQNLREWERRAHEDPHEPRAALGLFAAGAALGVRAVRGAPLHVLVEDASNEFLDEIGLQRVSARENADVVVRRPRFPECAFRGRVDANGVPVVDVLQVWLDVSGHPSRGREQGDEILSYLRLLGDPS